MKFHRPIITTLILIALVATLGVTGVLAQVGNGGYVRFVHVVPGAGAVDIYVDGELTISGLNFGSATTFVNMPAGDHSVNVTPSGVTTPLWNETISTADGTYTTLVASSTNPLGFQAFTDDLSPINLGTTRFNVIHAVSGGPTIDVLLSDGRSITENLGYGLATGTADIPVATYEIGFASTGGSLDSALIAPQNFSLTSNTVYSLVVYGTPAAPAVLTLSAAAQPSDDNGFVRFAHTVVDAPEVDIFVGDTRLVPGFGFGDVTHHLPLPAGTHAVSVRVSNTGEELLSTELNVDSGTAVTVVAFGPATDLTVNAFEDDISGINAEQGRVNIINALPGSSDGDAALADGTSLASGLGFGGSSTSVDVAATTQTLSVTLTLGDQSGTIELPDFRVYGGVYYNLFIVNGDAFSPPGIVVAATSIAQGIGSAPGSNTMTVASNGGGDTATAQESTPVPQVATAVPETPVPPAPTQPPATPRPETPTARIVLDPDANLHLRQSPSAEGQSLGLAPSGATLAVVGREGAPEFAEGVEPPDDLEEFVDPATLLVDEDEDLIPEETWLFVIYSTPDGGSIEAWVNALYLDVREPDGDRQRLADLPTVPNNRIGEAINTGITPPPVPEDRVTATVIGLNVGANLNIRRTPDTAGEILDRIPGGTVVELVGISEDGEWAFITHLPSGGGTVSGWVSTGFLEYGYNDRRVDLEELDQRELLVIVDTDRIGEIGSGTTPSSAPTADPLRDVFIAEIILDPGANLHLRRNPDAASESLNLIPSGTRIVVSGRTADTIWLQVTFEGTEGWIATQYVDLTFNGERADVIDIPIAPDLQAEATAEA